MSEDKNINVSIVPKFAETALENVLEEPSKAVGSTFNDIWFLTLGGPIGQLAEKRKMKYAADLEAYKKEIEEEISKVPNEKRCEVDIQIIGSIMEASKFCIEKEELRNMFSKLIASSMNTEREVSVHPAFPDMIRQLCPDEAKILKYLKSKLSENDNKFALVDIRYLGEKTFKNDNGSDIVKTIDMINETVRTVGVTLSTKDMDRERTVFSDVTDLGILSECEKSSNISSYLQNLEKMRIIDIVNKEIVFRDDYYRIINSEFIKSFLFSADVYSSRTKRTFGFIKKYFKLTSFGIDFVNTCIE